jgi:hypothetical protein
MDITNVTSKTRRFSKFLVFIRQYHGIEIKEKGRGGLISEGEISYEQNPYRN